MYKTAQGKTINLDNLLLQNETVLAVGNMHVNARGDEVDSAGNVVRTRQQRMKEHFGQVKDTIDQNNRRK